MAARTRKSGPALVLWILIHTALGFITGGLWFLFLIIRFLIR